MKAYSLGLKSHHVTPQTLTTEELQAIPSQEVISSSLPYWNVHLLPKKIQYSSSKDPNYLTDFLILFSSKQHQHRHQHQHNCALQLGIPFDLKYHLLNDSLTLQRIYDHQTAPKRSLENQKPSLHQLMELVTDAHGGFLYYCGKRDVYHWKKMFLSMNYYDSLRYQKLPSSLTLSSSAYQMGGGRGGGSPSSPSSLHSPAYTGRGQGRGGGMRRQGNEGEDQGRQSQQMPREELESMKERVRYSLAKRSYSYQPLALLEHRTENNIWSDLEMTKPPSSSPPLPSLTKNTMTSSFQNLMRVITEDEDEGSKGDEKNNKATRGGGGEVNGFCLNDYLLLQSEITPLNIPPHHHNDHRVQQRQLLNHLYLNINHQFIHLMISSQLYPPYHLPLSSSLDSSSLKSRWWWTNCSASSPKDLPS